MNECNDIVLEIANHFKARAEEYEKLEKKEQLLRKAECMINVVTQNKELYRKAKAWEETISLLENIVKNKEVNNSTLEVYRAVLNMMYRTI
ncbi:hypothetical protein CW676_07870 [Macrococcoides caseolyticum]|uniref:Uncharacterized protein n=2 Tax=Staphylococcaceae TaxID=90964 RepID=A0A8F8LUS8_9STAP|nr:MULTISPECIES: hypothetical protein [Macrococcus]PKE06448.1 hypothetical protein CW692_08420 [Macrococcus caseolyticus]PKE23571.1 hypothetical protein CW689_08500 [Macrococcus caseolyticus]PKE52909.1 hypothetical protein CW676_07870 [Macrococcus caseolyticus]PKF37583.1 hypothetical protein CW681_11260 [Macrococcus caseolyticus]QYA33984.1 hypothetical protein KYI10_11290 [Macrococcus sp. 19Msa1099]